MSNYLSAINRRFFSFERWESASMLITITKFAELRNVDRDTINAYIRKHPEIQQFVRRQGKNSVIDTDSDGYMLLEKQYPLPQMIQIIEDTESRQKLIKAQELIIQLQEQLTNASQKIAQAEAMQLMLEDKNIQIQKFDEQIKKAEARLIKEEEKVAKAQEKIDSKDAEIKLLQEALAKEHSKSWFQKLLGK